MSDSKKSLERVFQDSLCHPSMAMVLDDRRDVWDERDRHRVMLPPGYKPLVAPADEVISCILMLWYFDLCRSYLK